jgi:ribosomal protein L27
MSQAPWDHSKKELKRRQMLSSQTREGARQKPEKIDARRRLGAGGKRCVFATGKGRVAYVKKEPKRLRSAAMRLKEAPI